VGVAGLVLLFIILATSVLLGSWVLLSDHKSKANIWFAVIAILIITWNVFAYLGYRSIDTGQSLVFFRLNFAAVSLFFLAVYRFTIFFPVKNHKDSRVASLAVAALCVFFALFSVFTDKIIKDVIIPAKGELVVGMGGFGNLYYAFTILLTVYILYVLVKKHFSISKSNQDRTKIFLIGTLIYAVCNLVFSIGVSFILPKNYNYTQLGDFSAIIFLGFAAYATIKHQLFDLRFAVVRSVTYTLVLASLAGIYIVVAFILSAIFNRTLSSPEQVASGVVISLLLAFIFQPLRRFFDRITNRIFYKDNYNTDDFFARLNKTLSTTTDLRGLLERVSYEIGTTLKAEQAFFFIFTTPDGHYITAGTEGHKQLPKHDAVLFEQKTQGNDEVFGASEFDDNDPVRRMMISHRIELVLPLIQDDAVIGYLCLGEHKTSGYTRRDIRALNTLSDELVIAIQNALSIHEIRELNASLQQKIANATRELRASNAVLRRLDKVKDEFISMASHQLRTPLTSVKGYLSMVLEGDAGKISNSQRQLLNEAFMSSERMVNLINDFLNVSRIQTGKFIIDKTQVDLSKLVAEEIDSLKPNAVGRSLRFVYKKPRKFPIIEVDEGKMRQVVMNFADNAIYYSHEKSLINVNLSVVGKEVVFTVKDTGIGVPKGEREHLFTKFYRASNARIQRPDGTGVGIYLAKKVIDAHGGQIIFESVEGKGSTFGFRLPLPTEKLSN
jgi:signal transduction histidine kinase